MLLASASQHKTLTVNTVRIAAATAMTYWIFGGPYNPSAPLSADMLGSPCVASSKSVVETFSGPCISKTDFEHTLRKIQSNICLALAKPLKQIVDGLLSEDPVSGKTLVDELYQNIDYDRDGTLDMDEIKKACSTVKGVKADLASALPDEFEFADDCPFNGRVRDFLVDNRDNLQTSMSLFRLFLHD
jgi:hypothetical protein